MPDKLAVRLAARVRSEQPELVGAGCVLAASGGGDSTALVGLLCEAGLIDRAGSVIAHFDHRLRDEGSAQREHTIAEQLAERVGLPLVTGAWDNPVRGEQAARHARYGFLAGVGRHSGARVVATGHTSDDQVETLLLRMARGTGVHGLAGMRSEAPWPLGRESMRLWRPLLRVSRAETRAYCEQLGLDYVDEVSNGDRRFARNALRLDVLPALERLEPDVRASLLRLADAAAAVSARLDAEALPAIVGQGTGEVMLSRATLRAMPTDVAAAAFRLALTSLLGDAREFERRHYAIMVAAPRARTGSTFELPRRMRLTVDRDEIMFTRGAAPVSLIPAVFETRLPFAGLLGGWQVDVHPASPGQALPAQARLRGRRPGDRIRPPGLGGTKKLQDYYVDRHVPRRLRDAAPVIAVGGLVLWTPFGRGEAALAAGDSYAIEATPLSA